jgi:alkylation response protein AidB-like acyl-CoA dehydrogenase
MVPGAGIDLNDEQRALRDAVRSLLDRHPERADDRGPGYDVGLWRRLCQQIGVAGLAVPECYGGAGAGPVETHIVAEELGRDLTATRCSARPC